MLLEALTSQATATYIDEELDPAHIRLLRMMTVKLTGGVQGGVFTGSGVVFLTKGPDVYILTAKHNLHVAGKGTGKSGEALEKYFKQKISVELRKHAGGVCTATIASIRYPDETVEDQHYDVCLLKCSDLSFATQVNAHVDRSKGISWLFTSPSWQRQALDGGRPLFETFEEDDAQEMLANGWGFSPRKNYKLLQFGYGKIADSAMAGYEFRERMVDVAAVNATSNYIATTDEGYEQVFSFPSTPTDTALEGDSGGPIFAIDSTGTRSFLVGVHLGANYYSDQTNDGATENNSFTVLTRERLFG
ncbi:hypothetical protein [Enhygromyxa salina]|uniref:Peptidase S1 domain-containing protein n=1 Tax=Enhygromyxa salina TaxID=215803 RepID=A0A2S9YSH9_9BACT|nr:hypothetical protein [Enhygromyxa salina]PRQ08065.1 hypothetical protein ENSA7_22190 [Enhygromyxa salina]